MKRTIIQIDENLCNGCGNCITGCHEGALKLVDGKARMISDLYCDGLGACIGECPVGAISFIEREAAPYDEIAVMERILPKGKQTIMAHLLHLRDHNELEYYREALQFLEQKGINIDIVELEKKSRPMVVAGFTTPKSAEGCFVTPKKQSGCPGSMSTSFSSTRTETAFTATKAAAMQPSRLNQWPVQLHLLNPQAAFLRHADVVLTADCAAYAYADFHEHFLKDKALAIACPKLDHDKQVYVDKLVQMIDLSEINSLHVVIMEVPCCKGLLRLANEARAKAIRKIPLTLTIIGTRGNIVRKEIVN